MDTNKNPRFTFTIMDSDAEALQRIKDQAPFNGIEVDRTTIIRYAIRKAGNLDDATVVLATRADVEKVASKSEVMRLIGLVEGLILGRADGRGRPAGVATKHVSPYVPKEEREEEVDGRGVALCEIMGGRVEGRSCYYKKYEVMATGRAVSYEVSEAVTNLNDSSLDKQYDPDKEAWDRANV